MIIDDFKRPICGGPTAHDEQKKGKKEKDPYFRLITGKYKDKSTDYLKNIEKLMTGPNLHLQIHAVPAELLKGRKNKWFLTTICG